MSTECASILPDPSIFDAIVFDDSPTASAPFLSSPPPPYSVQDEVRLSPDEPLPPSADTPPVVSPLTDASGRDEQLSSSSIAHADPVSDMNTFRRLTALFPDTEPDMIESVVEAHAGNFELSREYMLQYPKTFARAQAPEAHLLQPKTQQLNGRDIKTLFLISKISQDTRFSNVPEDVVQSVVEEVGLDLDTPNALASIHAYLLPLVEGGAFDA